ncbi:MAG: hypothetical protein KDK54_21745, partial [Leptospiraceae bacterium]|nr:hypothetical protein [Leptospiraceae bacterium]
MSPFSTSLNSTLYKKRNLYRSKGFQPEIPQQKQILSILILRKYRFRSRNLMDQKFRDVGSVLRLSFFARKFRAKGTL